MTITPIGDGLDGGIVRELARKPPEPHPKVVEFPAWPREQRVGRRLWRLDAPYRVEYEMDGERYRLTVPAGFLYDGASVPRFVWSILAADKLHKASVPHDFAYEVGGVMPLGSWQWIDERGVWRDVPHDMTRKHSDRLLRLMARKDDEGPRTGAGARAAYRGVRWFGGSSWGPKPPRKVEQ